MVKVFIVHVYENNKEIYSSVQFYDFISVIPITAHDLIDHPYNYFSCCILQYYKTLKQYCISMLYEENLHLNINELRFIDGFSSVVYYI